MKRIIVALAALALTLGLTAAPATAVTEAPEREAAEVTRITVRPGKVIFLVATPDDGGWSWMHISRQAIPDADINARTVDWKAGVRNNGRTQAISFNTWHTGTGGRWWALTDDWDYRDFTINGSGYVTLR